MVDKLLGCYPGTFLGMGMYYFIFSGFFRHYYPLGLTIITKYDWETVMILED